MADIDRDSSLDHLLELDGLKLAVDDEARDWVEFKVRRVSPSAERPHGLSYALMLYDRIKGERLAGLDNAHPLTPVSGPSGKKRRRHDHRHRLRTAQPYDYRDAGTLLEDF